jgi:hypothetical protein
MQNQYNQQAVLLQALALLIGKLGYGCPGGKELYFSDDIVRKLSPYGQLMVDRHPEKPGFVVRYIHNTTIPGKGKVIEPVEPTPLSVVVPGEPAPLPPPESETPPEI